MPAASESDLQLEIAHILLIDIVGYSKLLITEQRERLETLKDIVRNTAQFRASDVNGMLLRIPTGDGMALIFRDSVEAPVRCALEISRALKSHPEIHLRMGIHSGPVSEITDVNERVNIAGAGIDTAQRVMDCGDAGHILLSKHVADDLAPYPRWNPYLHDLGECAVKHGARLHIVNLYTEELGNPKLPEKFKQAAGARKTVAAISGPTERSTAWRWTKIGVVLLMLATIAVSLLIFLAKRSPTGAISLAATPEKSIAVLPFENLSHDPENAYFADGIQEEVLTRLAKIADLKVISRTSTARYKSSPDNLREIAAQLGVAHIIEGGVQRAGDQVRVNVQLIKAANDAHLWAETYDRNLHDIFAVESEIARGVADTLQAKLTGAEKKAITTRPTENTEAHQLYLQGRFFWNKRTSDGMMKSIDYFTRAIEKDPAYALAYAGLADAYTILPNYSQTLWNEAYPRAKAAVLKALELDDNVAEAHIALANLKFWNDWARGAEEEFKRGIELSPSYATGHHWYSIYLSAMGRHQEAIVEITKAQELDPFSLIIDTELGLPYLYAHQYDQAITHFQRAIEMDPNFAFAHFALAEAYDRKRRYEEALAEHDKSIALAGEPSQGWLSMTGLLKDTYKKVGGTGYWQKRLELTRKLYTDHAVTAKAVAEIYAILGDREQTLGWLEKSYQEHDRFLVFLKVQSEFDNLRSDPRFEALVAKVFSTQKSSTPSP
jgi:adenylate cyclase